VPFSERILTPLSFRADSIGEESACASNQQIPHAILLRFRMTILNKPSLPHLYQMLAQFDLSSNPA